MAESCWVHNSRQEKGRDAGEAYIFRLVDLVVYLLNQIDHLKATMLNNQLQIIFNNNYSTKCGACYHPLNSKHKEKMFIRTSWDCKYSKYRIE